MSNLKLSIHAPQHVWLRQLFIQRRLELGLSQRALAIRLGVIYSFVGKVETGDRRLDILEFVHYCAALQLDASHTLQQAQQIFYPQNPLENEEYS
ncbi:MAG: XRE family transcriptional regulator [Acinetobacter sp.]|nr:MAG: XRE family transcriptional regulator [Acinetobacter sp.]